MHKYICLTAICALHCLISSSFAFWSDAFRITIRFITICNLNMLHSGGVNLENLIHTLLCIHVCIKNVFEPICHVKILKDYRPLYTD